MQHTQGAHPSDIDLAPATVAPRSSSVPAAGAALAVVWGGISYQVIGASEIAAQIPVTTTTATTVPPDSPPTTAAPDTGPTDNSGLVALLGLAVFVGAVVTIMMKGRKSAVRH